MIGRARPGSSRSSSDVTTLPPSSGSTGMRLNAPIAGPAHHTAADAGELPRLTGSSGSTPIASSTAMPATMWVSGPASAIHAWVPRESGRGDSYDA